MILVNVLLIVALAASVVMLMTMSQDSAVQRSLRLSQAEQAAAIARGGELSAASALRADAVNVEPHGDPMRAVAQRAVKIAGGSFELAVSDAQARYNLNALLNGDLVSRAIMLRIVGSLGVPRSTILRAALLMRADGALLDLAALHRAGIDQRAIGRLATMVTVLPVPTRVNLNSADEPLIAAMIGNPTAARVLVGRRARRGFLSDADLKSAGVVLPGQAMLGSDVYWVRSRATIGDTSQQLTSILLRRYSGGKPEVVAIARWWGAAAPVQAPPL